MNAHARPVTAVPMDWVQANQQALVAEFRRLRARIDGREPETAAPVMADAAIEHVARVFGLSEFERALLLLCAGVEMDSGLADACASANANRGVTFGFAMGLLEEPHWSALAPSSPLRRWRLIELQDHRALTTSTLRIDERVLHHLAGVNALDARLSPLLRLATPAAALAPSHEARMRDIVDAWNVAAWPPALIELIGDDPDGAEDIVAHAAAQLGQQAFVLRAEDLPATTDEIDTFATLWQREAVLLPAALLVACENATPPGLANLVDRIQTPLVVASREPLRARRASVVRDVRKPDSSEQKRLWQEALSSDRALDTNIDAVASHFRLSARAIADAAGDVERAVADGDDPSRALWQACRRRGRHKLDDLAQSIEPRAEWDDLVLPQAQTDTLRQIAVHLRHRLQVHHTWGFGARGARGLGLSALFCGESGTGKTLAAEVIANTLALDLYRIDLAAIVSKYIGETEKNLRRVFEAAEDSGAILVFDEADALFGKRSEVKDSHDRYANIEVSYLLQRMEAYRGLAILTTNLKGALDTAFQRRLRFIVQFPFPDATQREAIWRRAFPSATPTCDLDYAKLAALHTTGGGIHNVAMQAAFLAAEDGDAIGMRHLLRAAQAERAKAEKPLAAAETRGWM